MQVIKTPLAIGVYALVAWFGLYLLIASILRMWARTSHLCHAHRAHIAESFVSGVQGVACSIMGVFTVKACWRDVRLQYPRAVYYSSVGAAYFIYDLWAMYYSYSVARKYPPDGSVYSILSYLKKNGPMIAHHLSIVTLLFPAIVHRSSMGHFFVGCFFCMEFSTPFVNARVILSRLGQKKSRIYIINGLLMMTVFLICRVAMFPVMYAVYLSQQTVAASYIHALASIPIMCNLSCLLGLLLQIYWLGRMVKGALAVMNVKSPSHDRDD